VLAVGFDQKSGKGFALLPMQPYDRIYDHSGSSAIATQRETQAHGGTLGDLSRPDTEFQSPAWHADELAATERRLAEGKEEILDWEVAKRELRSKAK
jgi:hypothetical protein